MRSSASPKAPQGEQMATKPSSRASAASKPAPPPPAPGEERVVLLTGAEAGRKHAYAESLLKEKVAPDGQDCDSEIMDGTTAAADRILSGVASAPMGEGRRAVLVRDTQQMTAEEQKSLAEGLASIPASG